MRIWGGTKSCGGVDEGEGEGVAPKMDEPGAGVHQPRDGEQITEEEDMISISRVANLHIRCFLDMALARFALPRQSSA